MLSKAMQHRIAVAGVVGGLAVGAVAVRHQRASKAKTEPCSSIVLPRPIKDAICGAAGEILQILVLYPVEAVKVRCQDQGIGWMIVLRGLLKDKGLMGVTCLWSGLGSSAVLSILVGAVHWLSFSAAKRWASGISSNHELGDEVKANFIGAGAGALCTALVESPIEEFRHRAQAGVISGSLGKEMARSISQFGFLSLYAGFAPFLMEAIPYDLAELSTYANLQSTYKELFRISEPGSWQSKVINALPAGAWDLVLGGAAGGAAVAMSMPFDTIKTKIQTRNSRASNPLGQVKEFVKVGRHLVRTTGWKSLFLGVTPRLVQQVPGSALCWWGVQSVDKLLEGV